MNRRTAMPRPNWPRIVEKQGFYFHSSPEAYWNESAYYEFTAREVDVLEAATEELHGMCLEAVNHVIGRRLFHLFNIPDEFIPFFIDSWTQREATIYGRFDFSFDGVSPPKMLEYNADTPTALLEAAVIQWFWLQDTNPLADQFNSIHERLIDLWREIRNEVEGILYFAAVPDSMEDYITASYLRDTAVQAGLQTDYLEIDKIGWHEEKEAFVDVRGTPIRFAFKLYPWEWMVREEFGPHLLKRTTRWFEPPWKMILSNKAILPVLWQLFPNHPNLLRTDFEPVGDSYVRKPMLAREGANIQVVFDGKELLHTDGPYQGPYVYQELCPLPRIEGKFAAIGSWIVGDTACGMGIRESPDLITRNTSRFVPHLFQH